MKQKIVDDWSMVKRSRRAGWKLLECYEVTNGAWHYLMGKGEGSIDARDRVTPLDELIVAHSYGNGHGWYLDEQGGRSGG